MGASPNPVTQGAVPGANVSGRRDPAPGGGTHSVGSGGGNPFLPSFPSGQTVTNFPANLGGGPTTPFQMPTIPGSQQSFFGGLKSAGYPGQIAAALSNFLQLGAGYSPQVAAALIAAMQPQVARGEADIMEQFGAMGLGDSSAAAIGLGDYLSRVQLNEGEILSGLYEQAVQNYMNILMGTKKGKGGGALGSLSSLLGGLGGGGGIMDLISGLGGLGGGGAAAGLATLPADAAMSGGEAALLTTLIPAVI